MFSVGAGVGTGLPYPLAPKKYMAAVRASAITMAAAKAFGEAIPNFIQHLPNGNTCGL